MSETTTVTLTDFLLARIAEDEARYDAAAKAEADSVRHDGMPDTTAADVKAYWATVPTRWPRHLAECKAKRRIVALHSPVHVCTKDESGDDETAWDQQYGTACPTLTALATVYVGHPDYRSDWD